MAIQCNFNWRGILIKDAYIRVDIVTGGKRWGQIVPEMPFQSIWQGQVGIYSNSDERVPLLTMDISCPWNGEESPYPTLYDTLKAMPEFAGAVDC